MVGSEAVVTLLMEHGGIKLLTDYKRFKRTRIEWKKSLEKYSKSQLTK